MAKQGKGPTEDRKNKTLYFYIIGWVIQNLYFEKNNSYEDINNVFSPLYIYKYICWWLLNLKQEKYKNGLKKLEQLWPQIVN